MDRPAHAPRERAAATSAALTALSSIATMGLGAAVAVLVLLLFGAGVRTDALFAAYAVYALLLAAAQGMRIALVPQLVAARGFAPLDRLVSATLLLAVLLAVPFVLLGGVSARLLVGGLGEPAVAVARTSLALLWAAGALQLLAGLLAAALGARRSFGAVAGGYVAGALVTVVALPVLAPVAGVVAVPVAVLLGSGVVAGSLAVVLSSAGWRWRPLRPSAALAGGVVAGSVHQLALQVAHLVTLAFAARLGPGEVTTYSYAFFAALLLLGATAGPAGMVLAGPVAETWDRRPRSLVPQVAVVTQATAALAAPALVVAALVGADLLGLLLGDALPAGAREDLVVVLLTLSGFVVLTAAAAVPAVACFAQGRYRAVAGTCALAVAQHAAVCALALATGRLWALGLAATWTAAVTLLGLLALLHGRDLLLPLRALAATVGRVAAAAGVAFAPAVLAADASAAVQALALAGGLLLYVASARWLLPTTYELVRSVVPGARR